MQLRGITRGLFRNLYTHGFLAAAATLAIFAITGAAQGGLVTYNFAGSVTSVDTGLEGTFSNGDAITGSFTVDDSVGPRGGGSFPGETNVFDALVSFQVSFGSYTASLTGGPTQEIQVDVNGPNLNLNDRYAVVTRASDGLTGADVGGLALDSMFLRLDDTTNTVFTGADISTTLPTDFTLANFTDNFIALNFVDIADPGSVTGTLNSLAPANVPEPGTMGLSLIATIAMGGNWLRRRRARAA